MSFTGIFRARDGLAVIADSKATIEYSKGQPEEYIGRNPVKLHNFPNGVALVYGALQIFTENKARVFAKEKNVEVIIQDYILRHKTLDAAFFQELLYQMNSSSLNVEPVRFIIGRKIWTGKYQIEYHKVGYDYYAMKIAKESEICFVGGSELYVEAFRQMNFKEKNQSAEELREHAVGQLQKLIDFYDEILEYNPVGGTIRSFVFQ